MKQIILPFDWEPRQYQLPTWNFFEQGGRRAVSVWHRRAGKDLFSINHCVVQALQRIGLYWHILPTYNQGRKIVWDGATKDGRRFLDHFPKDLIARKNDTDMKITLKNGSIFQVVGAEDPDRLVGANPVGCIFSEYSVANPRAWDLIRPILAENDGWAHFIYTPRGNNHGKRLLVMAQKNPKWFATVLKAGSGPEATKRFDGSPVISDEVLQDERDSGISEALLEQEYFCSFEAPIEGAYYAKQMIAAAKEGETADGTIIPSRIGNVPYEPNLRVHTAWDLGISDAMTIWFFQEYGFETRLIDYYENSGEGFEFYANVLKEKGYNYGTHFAPHDIMVRELGTGKSRFEVARTLGIRFRRVKKHLVPDGINAVRALLPTCWFDKVLCERGIDCLRQYRKEEDTRNPPREEGEVLYKDTPLHDWTAHGADGFRILAMGKARRSKEDSRHKPQTTLGMDYDPLG